MPVISDPVVVALVSALGASLLGPAFNSLLGDRLARRKNKESLDATLSQATIADGAATRAELWARIEKLEAQNERLLALPRGIDIDTLKAYEELDERRRTRIEELESALEDCEENARRLERELATLRPKE